MEHLNCSGRSAEDYADVGGYETRNFDVRIPMARLSQAQLGEALAVQWPYDARCVEVRDDRLVISLYARPKLREMCPSWRIQ